MAVNIADVLEAELAYERARQHGRRQGILDRFRGVMQPLAESWNGK